MSQIHYYETDLHWTGGRRGEMNSPALNDSIEVATPPEFDGGVEGVWSPEHLFVASVSSCLMTTFAAIAEYSHLSYHSFSCKAKGKLEKKEGKFMISEIVLQPVVEISAEGHREKAIRILEKAEAGCLVSNSIKTEIVFEPRVEVVEAV